MNFVKMMLKGCVVAISLATTSSSTFAASLSGDLFYTRYATDASNPASVKKVGFNYDNSARTFTLGTPINIANTGFADGIVFAPDGDLIVGAGSIVHKVNPNTGTFSTTTAGGTDALHLALDPTGQKVWGGTEGPPGTNKPLAEIPLTGSFSNGIARPLTGDDQFITAIAFDDRGRAFYTAGGESVNGSFGLIDLNTLTTKRLLGNIPDAHGMVFDPFTLSMILFRGNHISQINLNTGAFSDRALPNSIVFDGGTVDAKGHLVVADSAGGNVVFMDFSATGMVGDLNNFVATTFLDSHLDDIAPLSGPGSEPVPEPATILGTLAFGTFAARWRIKRKQQEKSLHSTVV
jgi:hypothetical protein